MSNPAVIKLSETKLSNGMFVIEDNIGEAIHVHYSDFRFDISIIELHKLAEECEKILDAFVNLKDYKTCLFDGSFLMDLAPLLPDLINIRNTELKVKNLIVDTTVLGYIPVYRKIEKSRVIAALNGKPREDNKRKQLNYFNETNSERTRKVFESIKMNGYVNSGANIVLYNNKLNIMDGQHRASSVYMLNKEATIPVTILEFLDGKHSVTRYPTIKFLFYWPIKRIIKHLKLLYKAFSKKIKLIKYRMIYLKYRIFSNV